MKPRLLRVPDAHEEFGIEERYLRHMIAKRKIGTVRIGRAVYIPVAELERVIREGTRPARGSV